MSVIYLLNSILFWHQYTRDINHIYLKTLFDMQDKLSCLLSGATLCTVHQFCPPLVLCCLRASVSYFLLLVGWGQVSLCLEWVVLFFYSQRVVEWLAGACSLREEAEV